MRPLTSPPQPALWLLFAALAASCSPDPEPPAPTPPSFERCDAITTERACFEAGCSFFASASTITGFMTPTCAQGQSFAVCLFSSDPQGPDRLTTYTRTTSGGEVQATQLSFDVDLEGWDRCGNLAIPPDCDCDGE